MPSLANITVKKNDGTTDIVWSGIAAASGDSSPAVWRSETVGTAVSHRPVLRMTSKDNVPKTLRRVDVQLNYPEPITGTDSITRVANNGVFTLSVALPNGMADAVKNEFVSQGLNLLASTLVKDCVKSGFAAT